MKNNHHAIIDPKTRLVRNVIVWDGNSWLPPKDHYVVNNCDATIGDYWHQETNRFYTPNKKRRMRNEEGHYYEVDLDKEDIVNLDEIFPEE